MLNLTVLALVKIILFDISGKNGSGSGGASSSADIGINKGRPQSGKGAGPSYTCPKVKVRSIKFFNLFLSRMLVLFVATALASRSTVFTIYIRTDRPGQTV